MKPEMSTIDLSKYKTPRANTAARKGAYLMNGDYSSTGGKQIVHISFARRLEQELAACREALQLAVDCAHHGQSCTFSQRQNTGCVCGRSNAVANARATLEATKGDAQ